MVCPGGGRGGTAPCRSSCGPLCRTRDREDEFSLCVPVFDGAAALRPVRSRSPGQQGRMLFHVRRPADRPAVRQALAGPVSPPCSVHTLPVIARMLVQPGHHRWHGVRLLAEIRRSSFLILLSYCGDAVCCPPAVRQGSGKAHTGASPAAIRRHKKRRPPAWRPADVWSRFRDAARGIRTACRAGKRWPRNRRPARRHCSTGHGSGSWPGSCARRTWA